MIEISQNIASAQFRFIWKATDLLLKNEKISYKNKKNIVQRLLRVAIIGDILYKNGNHKIENEIEWEKEFLAGLSEGCIFLIRTIYDYLTPLFGSNLPSSFNELLKRIERDKVAIPKDLKKSVLILGKNFDRLKLVRDSLKYKNIHITVKNKKYYIEADLSNKKKFSERLSFYFFEQSLFLALMIDLCHHKLLS